MILPGPTVSPRIVLLCKGTKGRYTQQEESRFQPSCKLVSSKAFISGDLTRPPRLIELSARWPVVVVVASTTSLSTLYRRAFLTLGACGCGKPA